MSQHDMIIENASGAVVRADLNDALQALATCSSGSSAPGTTSAFMWWADTANDLLKQRNSTNSAWISVLKLSTGMSLMSAEANAGPGDTQLGFRNKIINGNFSINQRAYVSGAAVGTALYGMDRWKMAASGDTFTFATVDNKTTVTIPASKVLRQVVEGLNLQTGTYTLSWEGTAQGKIGAGALSASGVTGAITGGVNTTIEFGPGTLSNVQLEIGSVATPFEHRHYGFELSLCQRYLPAYSVATSGTCGTGVLFSASTASMMVIFPERTRVPPTSMVISTTNAFTLVIAGTTTTCTGVTFTAASNVAAEISLTGLVGTSGQGCLARATGSITYRFEGCEL